MPESKSLSVLLIDDSITIRRWWRIVLSDIPGVTVVGEAANTSEALALFEKLRPNTVLLDVEMPGDNGFQLLGEIRKRDRACLVIAMASYADEGYERACYELGADHYFAKLGGAEAVEAVLKARLGR